MKYALLTLLLLVNALGGVRAQSVTYDDVVVVVNSNDSVSVALGNYFMAARSIPAVNLIAVDAPTVETVDATQFQSIRYQIKGYMTANNLVGPINYMVMMKGMPHRVGTSYCDSVPPNGCSSMDSELTLLLSPDSALILGSGGAQNPLFQSMSVHSFAVDHTLLVTRLDGYTATDVTSLIDRSGPLLPITKQDALLVGDVKNAATPTFNTYYLGVFNSYLDPLGTAGWNTLVDTSNLTLTGLLNVAAYLSHDGLPIQGTPDLEWTNGALAMAYTYFTAGSFDPGATDTRKLRCADLVADGASGIRGSVRQAFASEQVDMGYTLQRYLGQPGSNLAESFYAGIQLLSRSDLIIGDPKTSLDITVGLGPDLEASKVTVTCFPNPATDMLTIPMDRFKVLEYRVLTLDGRIAAMGDGPSGSGPLSLSVSDLAPGTYLLQVTTTDGPRTGRFCVVH